ncbi:hypothetical protein G6F57_020160 [Rhizopus arrhizus]|nr:hypothetical protein G6F57_020160 [Rhizopus arrhizus]
MEPAYAAEKRPHTSSANERKTRSGKKVKVHDTVPRNHPRQLRYPSRTLPKAWRSIYKHNPLKVQGK